MKGGARGAALPLALAAACMAAASVSAQQPGALDCVIEPRSVVDLTPSVEGAIAAILVSRGDVVSAGTPVVQLNDAIERLQADLAALRAANDVELRSQQARLDLRRHELERVQSLKRRNVASDVEVDQAQIEVVLTELALERARTDREVARLEHAQTVSRLEQRRLTSPVSGVVLGVDAAPGEFAHEQMVILRIAEIDPLHVEVFAPAELYGTIRQGQRFEVAPVEPIGGSYAATVTVIDPVFDAASGTFGVRLELPNPDGTVPAGVRCRVLPAQS